MLISEFNVPDLFFQKVLDSLVFKLLSLSDIPFRRFVFFNRLIVLCKRNTFFSNQELQKKKKMQSVKKEVLPKEDPREFKSPEVQASKTLNYLIDFTISKNCHSAPQYSF